MANLPKMTKDELGHTQYEIDFDLKRVYDMPTIEQAIFFYTNFDKCRKEIYRYEQKRSTISQAQRHPKESRPEAINLLRCHSKNLRFEPVCLNAFNDARECLFKLDGQMRLCHNELDLFEECVHDPKRFEKFERLATPVQRQPKQFFGFIMSQNYDN